MQKNDRLVQVPVRARGGEGGKGWGQDLGVFWNPGKAQFPVILNQSKNP